MKIKKRNVSTIIFIILLMLGKLTWAETDWESHKLKIESVRVGSGDVSVSGTAMGHSFRIDKITVASEKIGTVECITNVNSTSASTKAFTAPPTSVCTCIRANDSAPSGAGGEVSNESHKCEAVVPINDATASGPAADKGFVFRFDTATSYTVVGGGEGEYTLNHKFGAAPQFKTDDLPECLCRKPDFCGVCPEPLTTRVYTLELDTHTTKEGVPLIYLKIVGVLNGDPLAARTAFDESPIAALTPFEVLAIELFGVAQFDEDE